MAYPFRRILVPHDGSAHATQALGVAASMAVDLGGRLIVLRAIAPFLSFMELGAEETTPWIPPEEVVGSELESLEALVGKALAGRRSPPAECRVIVGDAFSSIIDAAREADLIVMATHGRTGVDHLVIGSVAEKVVRHSPIPVLTLRKGASPTARAGHARERAHRTAAPSKKEPRRAGARRPA